MKKPLTFSLLIFFCLLSKVHFAQKSNAIDSLLKVSRKQKNDTSKINTLGRLSAALLDEKIFDRARIYADSLLLLSGKLNYKKGPALYYYIIGYIQHQTKNYDSAHYNIDKSIALSKEYGDYKRLAENYNVKGNIYVSTKKFEEAIDNYTKAIEILESRKSFEKLPIIYSNLTTAVFQQTQNPVKVLPLAKKSLDYAYIQKDFKQAASSCNHIGILYYRMPNYDSASFYFQMAHRHYIANNDKGGAARVTGNLAALYKQKGEIEKAIQYYKISIRDNLETGNNEVAARNLRNLNIAYIELGNYPEALNVLIQAVKIGEKNDNKVELAISYSFLTSFYLKRMEDTAKALKYGEAASNIFKETNSRFELADHLMIMAEIYEAQKEYDKAISCYNSALPVFIETGNKEQIISVYNSFGWNYKEQKLYVDAIREFKKSLQISEETDEKITIAYNNGNIGATIIEYAATLDSLNAREKYLEAKPYLEKALSMAKEMGIIGTIRESHHSLSQIDSALGNFPQALKHYKLYAVAKDSTSNEENTKQLNRLKLQFETEKKDKEIELLNKANELNASRVKQQQALLLASNLEAEKKQHEIVILNTSNEVRQLQLTEAERKLAQQVAEAKAKAAELKVISKDKQLKEQELENQKLLRNGLMIGTLLLMVSGIFVFRTIQLRRKLEKQQAIVKERKRISADLHDDVGSTLSSIRIMSAVAENNPQQAHEMVKKISENSKRMLENMGDIVWTENPDHDSFADLIARMNEYGSQALEPQGIRFKIISSGVQGEIGLDAEQRRNFYLIFKEAINNLAKYSGCTEASIILSGNEKKLVMKISDNGKGFEMNNGSSGNGLRNMHRRAEVLHADFKVSSAPGKGTTVELNMPVT